MRYDQKIHSTVANNKFFFFFTWFTRLLLAIAFIPSGWVKVQGERFTLISVDTQIGLFFESLYRTGIYWNFLGIMQLLTALLLLIPRTTLFGAILYFPIIVNIFIAVTSMHFRGTPVVTGLMVLANIYLLLWDYPKVRSIVKIVFGKEQLITEKLN